MGKVIPQPDANVALTERNVMKNVITAIKKEHEEDTCVDIYLSTNVEITYEFCRFNLLNNGFDEYSLMIFE